MELTALARTVHDFLVESRDAVVVEDGTTLFDLQTARYSLSPTTANACCTCGRKNEIACDACSTRNRRVRC